MHALNIQISKDKDDPLWISDKPVNGKIKEIPTEDLKVGILLKGMDSGLSFCNV